MWLNAKTNASCPEHLQHLSDMLVHLTVTNGSLYSKKSSNCNVFFKNISVIILFTKALKRGLGFEPLPPWQWDPEDTSDLVKRQAAPDPGEDEGREVRRGEGQGDRHPENRMDIMTPYKGGHATGLCSRHRPPQHSNPAVGLPSHSPPGSGEYSIPENWDSDTCTRTKAERVCSAYWFNEWGRCSRSYLWSTVRDGPISLGPACHTANI